MPCVVAVPTEKYLRHFLALVVVVVVVHLMSTVSQATHSKNKQQTVSGLTAAAAATTCHLPQPSPCGVDLASAVSALV